MAYRLSEYEAKIRVHERKHPKLYWVIRGLTGHRRNSTLPAVEELGSLLEEWVAGPSPPACTS